MEGIDLSAPRRAPREVKALTAKSQRHVENMLDFITKHETASPAQLRDELGLDAGSVSRYLRYMRDNGLVHLAQRHCTDRGAPSPSLYACGVADTDENFVEQAIPKVRLTSTWTKGVARRDPLVSALFGSAVNLEAA